MHAYAREHIDKSALTRFYRKGRVAILVLVFISQFRLGMFDPPSIQPYLNISLAEVNSPAHQQLALEAAHQGMVLLKNADNTLPLAASKIKTLAVIGPNGNALPRAA